MKKYVYTLGVLMILFFIIQVPAKGQLMELEQQKLDEKINLEAIQTTSFLENDKYIHIPTYEKDFVTYTVHEYVTPTNDIGYQIIIDDGDLITSEATGIEASSRTFTINRPVIKASSTPEI